MKTQNIPPVLVAFVEEMVGNLNEESMNEICRHLKIQATLEEFSDFIYAQKQLCGEELKMDRHRSDELFYAVSGDGVTHKWGKTFLLELMELVIANCLFPTSRPAWAPQPAIAASKPD